MGNNMTQYLKKSYPNGMPCGCDNKGGLPPWVYDVIAERKLTGGFKLKVRGKSNVCPECQLTRSVNGTCGC